MLIGMLNHNLPAMTDSLVNKLKLDPLFHESEFILIDNGSDEDKIAKHTTHKLDTNVFFGGGLNVALQYFLETKHEYMYFLNNDLMLHGPSFLTTSLREAKESDAAVYSPTIINSSADQCHWKQMWNWGEGVREVRWIDFQSPLMRRDILKAIHQYPQELMYGWGQDFYTGCMAHKMGVKTVISDNNTICHLNSQTFKQGVSKVDGEVVSSAQHSSLAERGMNNYFLNSRFKDLYLELRQYGETYKV